MRAKLGLTARVDDAVVTALAGDLLDLLHTSHVDYTSFFVDLGGPPRRRLNPPAGCSSIWPDSMRLTRWRALAPDSAVMDRANPIYLPRNHLLEQALTAATAGDPSRSGGFTSTRHRRAVHRTAWPSTTLPRTRPDDYRALLHLLRDRER